MTDNTPSTCESTATPRTPTRPKFAFDAATIMRKLTELGYYLGNDDMPTQVAFVPGGRAGDQLVSHNAVNEPQPEEVQLTLVGEVSRDGAWLSAEGAYRPASKLNPGDNVTGAKARFELVAPLDPNLALFRDDWDTYLSNIHAIHDAVLKDKAHHSERKDLVQKRPSRLIMRHPLVIERTAADNTTDSLIDGYDLSEQDRAKIKQLSFDGWPIRQAWGDELDAVKETHDINPLPAYDLDHSTIAPKDYERCLLGAIAEVHITLIHYLIGKKGSTMVADVQEMIVLRPPRELPPSPTKRSLIAGPSSNLEETEIVYKSTHTCTVQNCVGRLCSISRTNASKGFAGHTPALPLVSY
ncbi:hypothetical protein JB92DRAFT_3132075 [Gautieria morchelliformis]|nr:hypothetical protein JB92DRAFT_3132075 [Gautieria morchelliformis]